MPRPLGRRLEHDARSRLYPYRAAPVTAYTTVQHQLHIPVLDQGDTGSCTGNATVHCLGSDPFRSTVTATLDEGEALTIYGKATTLDSFPGTYPPDDTGSSGLAAAKAAKSFGFISGYQHAFTVDAALAALQQVPLITGVNWYSSFDEPTADGEVTIAPGATVRGGHEFAVVGYDNGRVWCQNSWGAGWGVAGRFYLNVPDWARLLSEKGDVTIFTPNTAPAPQPLDVDLVAWWGASKQWANARHVGDNAAAARAAKTLAATKGLV